MDIEKLMNDEAFAAQIENAKDLAEVAALLQAHGVEVTEKDLKAALTAEEGELDEASLEDVAGGKSTVLSSIKVGIKAVKAYGKYLFKNALL